jgi:hypothetical protein
VVSSFRSTDDNSPEDQPLGKYRNEMTPVHLLEYGGNSVTAAIGGQSPPNCSGGSRSSRSSASSGDHEGCCSQGSRTSARLAREGSHLYAGLCRHFISHIHGSSRPGKSHR